MSGQLPMGRPHGRPLKNAGMNYCYANVNHQFFAHTQPICNIINSHDREDCWRQQNGDFCTHCYLYDFLKESELQSTNAPFYPQQINTLLQEIAVEFQQGTQQDSAIMLQGLLSNMQKEEEEDLGIKETFIEKLCFMQTQMRTTCGKCQGILDSKKINEPVLLLGFGHREQRDQGRSITQLLDLRFQEEDLAAYKCEKCGKTSTSKKRDVITRLPEVLIIGFRRFKAKGDLTKQQKKIPEHKIDEDITLDEEISLDTYFVGNDNTTYVRHGVIYHIGGSTASGHYYCIFPGYNGQHLYSFNDVNINRMRGIIPSENAYMVVYVRKTGQSMAAGAMGSTSSFSLSSSIAPPPSVKKPKVATPTGDKAQLSSSSSKGLIDFGLPPALPFLKAQTAAAKSTSQPPSEGTPTAFISSRRPGARPIKISQKGLEAIGTEKLVAKAGLDKSPKYSYPPLDPNWERPEVLLYNRAGWNKVASKERIKERQKFVDLSIGPVLQEFLEHYSKDPTANASAILKKMGYEKEDLDKKKEEFKSKIEWKENLPEDMGYGIYVILSTPFLSPDNALLLTRFILALIYCGMGWKGRTGDHAGSASMVPFREDWFRIFQGFCEFYMSECVEKGGGMMQFSIDVKNWQESELFEAAMLANIIYREENKDYGALANVRNEENTLLSKMVQASEKMEGKTADEDEELNRDYLAAIGIRDGWWPLFELVRWSWETNQNCLVGSPATDRTMPPEEPNIPTVDAARKNFQAIRPNKEERVHKSSKRDLKLKKLKEEAEEREEEKKEKEKKEKSQPGSSSKQKGKKRGHKEVGQ